MPLEPGTRIGPYEIDALIGAGGMGEVYRAVDTNLGRPVAIKVLPDAVARDPDRIARFEREAKTLATLNHLNIATIHGVETSGDTYALVMEFVDGQTLAEKLAPHDTPAPLPVDEAIGIARQIASALEAAHEQGVIHRDLKPANIKVRPDGTVKVLDFGLAKLVGLADAIPHGDLVETHLQPSPTQVPTMTSPPTSVGAILGTASYMSPEQARGRPVDQRSDIWALGCVLYEMLTGQRAFRGDDVAEILGHVVSTEPDWTVLPPGLAPSVPVFLRRCLQKNPRQRIADAQDVRLALEGAFDVPASSAPSTSRFDWLRHPVVPAAALVAGLVIASLTAWYVMRPDVPTVIRTEIVTVGPTAFTLSGFDRDLAITPDGTRVIYRGQNQLIVRPLGQLDPMALTSLAPSGLSPVQGLFVSPDSQWIGFGSTDPSVQIRKVAITGGPSVTVASVDGVGSRGATWSEDGTVIFATAATDTGLQRVPAAGGEPVVLTRPNRAAGEMDHRWPSFLPGGQAVLFTIVPPNLDLNETQIALLDLRTQQQTVLLKGGHDARYVSTGHLIFGAGGTLRAVPFDLDRMAITGTPVPVVERVASTSDGGVHASISANGTLVYLPGGPEGAIGRRLVWVDRAGREEPIAAPARPYLYPRLSPDGQRLVVASQDLEQDLWMWDVQRATLVRLTFDPAQDIIPTWMPDGQRLLFGSARAGARNIYEQAADGSGVARQLNVSTNFQDATSVSPDGTRIVLNEATPNQGRDIRLLTLTPSPRVEPLVETRFEERGGILSPDGRWIAYESNSSGRFEIYVRPFPAVGDGQWQVSTAGGVQALWARSGSELFYRALDGAVMSVPVTAQATTWSAGTPTMLFKDAYVTGGAANVSRQYDVSPDGQRFVMLKDGGEGTGTQRVIVVVQNWFEELRRLASAP